MTTNRHPYQQLHQKRGMILRFSFAVSLGLVILAFQWKTEMPAPKPAQAVDEPVAILDIAIRTTQDKNEKMPEVEPLRDKPVLLESANIVETKTPLETLVLTLEDPHLADLDLTLTTDTKDETAPTTPFRRVEEMPSFPGGLEALYAYLQQEMRYPARERDLRIEGTVHVEFVVNEDGSISQINILRGVTNAMNEEVTRALAGMPRWNPGRQRGQAVKVYFTMPVKFALQ